MERICMPGNEISMGLPLKDKINKDIIRFNEYVKGKETKYMNWVK